MSEFVGRMNAHYLHLAPPARENPWALTGNISGTSNMSCTDCAKGHVVMEWLHEQAIAQSMTNRTQLWKMMVAEAALTATANEARSREFVSRRKGVASEPGSHLTLAMARDAYMKANALICQGHAGSVTPTKIHSF